MRLCCSGGCLPAQPADLAGDVGLEESDKSYLNG